MKATIARSSKKIATRGSADLKKTFRLAEVRCSRRRRRLRISRQQSRKSLVVTGFGLPPGWSIAVSSELATRRSQVKKRQIIVFNGFHQQAAIEILVAAFTTSFWRKEAIVTSGGVD